MTGADAAHLLMVQAAKLLEVDDYPSTVAIEALYDQAKALVDDDHTGRAAAALLVIGAMATGRRDIDRGASIHDALTLINITLSIARTIFANPEHR